MSRLLPERHTSVPLDVCKALGLETGDELLWNVVDGSVRIRRGAPMDAADVELLKRATVVDSKVFAEWLSDEDEEAWCDFDQPAVAKPRRRSSR